MSVSQGLHKASCMASWVHTEGLYAPHLCRLGFDEIKSASELCTAVAQGKVDLIRHYIKAGININAADYDKRTALHIAAADGCLEAVRCLHSFQYTSFIHHITPLGEHTSKWAYKQGSAARWHPGKLSKAG